MITDRIDNITHIPPNYQRTVLPAPKSVKIELTGRCNFACAFCARSQMLRDQHDIDRGFFERVVKEMREAGVEELGMFYLGESFMVSWLPEAIKYAKDVGFPYIFLTTNGSLSSPKKVKACMEAGLNSLKFSFNYADGEQLKEIARVKASYFDKIIENIKGAHQVRKDHGYSCGLYASFIEYDGEQGERMKDAVEQIRPYVDEVYALPLYNQATLTTEEERRRGWDISAGNRGRVGGLVPPIPCWAVFTEGHITSDGLLSACCFDHKNYLTMGDLKESSFMEAWNSEVFQKLRYAHLNKNLKGSPCEHCVAYK